MYFNMAESYRKNKNLERAVEFHDRVTQNYFTLKEDEKDMIELAYYF